MQTNNNFTGKQVTNSANHKSEHLSIDATVNKSFDQGKSLRTGGGVGEVRRPGRRRRPSKVRLDYACPDCSKAFDRASMLMRHRRVHTGEKPFHCAFCDKAFTTLSASTIHQRTHTGEKPHVCPTCHRAFAASSNLLCHIKTHSKVRSYLKPIISALLLQHPLPSVLLHCNFKPSFTVHKL